MAFWTPNTAAVLTREPQADRLTLMPESSESKIHSTALLDIQKALDKATTLNEAINIALASVCNAFGWAYGSYWKIDAVANVLRFQTEYGMVNPEFAQISQTASFAEGVGLNGRSWHERQLVFVDDLGTVHDCCRRESAQRAGVKSGIAFPMYMNGCVVGTMDFFTTETITLSEARRNTLKLVGQWVSQTVERIEAQQEARAIQELITLIGKASSRQEAAASALKTIKERFGWAYSSYWRLDGEKNLLVFDQECGQASKEFHDVSYTASFAEGVGLSGKTWQKRDLMFVQDLGTMVDCCRRETALRAGVKSGVCFPIMVGGKVRGTMDFFATEVLSLSETRLNTLRNVGLLVSSAFEKFDTIELMEKEKATAQALRETARELAEFSG